MVDSALTEALELALAGCSRQEVAEWSCGVQRLRARMDAVAAEAAVQAEDACVSSLSGLRSVPSFIAHHTTVDAVEVADDRRIGRWVSGFGAFAKASEAGQLTRKHLRLLRRCDNTRTREALLESQDQLVEAATTCSFRDFQKVLRAWMLAFDPDGEEPRHQHDNRRCKATKRWDGTVHGTFGFDPVQGDAFLNALEAEEKRLVALDADNGTVRTVAQRRADALVELVIRGAQRSDGTTTNPLTHLVLGVELAETMLADPPPTGSGPEPRGPGPGGPRRGGPVPTGPMPRDLSRRDRSENDLNPTTPDQSDPNQSDPDESDPNQSDHGVARGSPWLRTGFGMAAVGRAPPSSSLVDLADPGWRCELADGTPLHPHWARHILERSTMRRLVVDGARVCNLGRAFRAPDGARGKVTAEWLVEQLGTTGSVASCSSARTYPAHMRHAVIAAARGRCNVAGCDALASWLQVDHHHHPHSRGGVTSFANARCKCGFHNGAKGAQVPPP
jgi:hypothetical protein